MEYPSNMSLNSPVRVKIIEYVDIKTDPIDPALFSIPDGYKAISPF